MKLKTFVIALFLSLQSAVMVAGKSFPTAKMYCRDPFILVDRHAGCYYLIVSARSDKEGRLALYKSRDLSNWEYVRRVVPQEGVYQNAQDWWAPDTYEWKGNHYVFVTVTPEEKKRGTAIFRSTGGIGGLYKPVSNERVVMTPENMQSLDASLYVDKKGKPWLVFSREWLECHDGEIWAQRLSKDLSQTIGQPVRLFAASEAPWCVPIEKRDGHDCYVTDAPYIIRDKATGHLIMLWSSFANIDGEQKYVFAQAVSESGKIEGPWKQDPRPLNTDDGGHTMIFKDLQGRLRVSYHSPNSVKSATLKPTLTLGEIEIKDGRIVSFIKDQR